MSLADVGHQGKAQHRLQLAVSRDRVPHAYVFHGPDGVGKEKFAVGLAELLLCDQPVDEVLQGDRAETAGIDRLRMGCGLCVACRGLANGTHPDLHLIYRQLSREHPKPEVRRRKALEIGVDVLRHFVIAKVGLTPSLGRAKVFIVREADRITPQAQNALLKTLEEPPGATVIMLLVTALDRLLPTTQSRCQVVRFDALPTDFVEGMLAKMLPDLPAERVEWLARLSEGSLGRALGYSEDHVYELNQRLVDGFAQLAGAARVGELVKAWVEESKGLGSLYRKRDRDITDTEATRRALKTIFELAATLYADVLRFASGDRSGAVNKSSIALLEQAAGVISGRDAIEAINRIARAEHELDLNVNTQLCVETLVNDLSRIFRRRPVEVV